jgi:hypothetical protein
MRKVSQRESELSTALMIALMNLDQKTADALYDEIFTEMKNSGATLAEMVEFGIVKAIKLDQIRAEMDNITNGLIH